MPTATRPSGVTVRTPDTFQIADLREPGVRRPAQGMPRGPIPMPSTEGTGEETDALLAALEQQQMQMLEQFEVQPTMEATPLAGRRSAGSPLVPESQTIAVDVDLGAAEDAVLLVEQDGMYRWHMPASTGPLAPLTPQPSSTPLQRGVRAEAPGRRSSFRIEVLAEHRTAAPGRRNVITDFIYGKVKIYAIKFVARLVVGQTMKYLERNVRTSLIQMNGPAPENWAPITGPQIKLPGDRPARILLFVHGTFSSTIGSFGHLGGTPWGQAFLAAAAAHYDFVLGFDHSTLGEDPYENATHLLRELESLQCPAAPQIDAIAFSRGGLVLRSLIEQQLPASTFAGRIRRAIFVACTNGGTKLAETENWQTLLDLYTNLAVASFRVLSLLPQATAPALVLKELVQSLGAFVKYLAMSATTDVPGLAAMRPGGDFVKRINQTQENQPGPAESLYYAVTSEFAPVIASGDQQPKELPLRLVMALAEGLIKNVMNAPNDLVVDTASMVDIDSGAGGFIKDVLAFGATPLVYHTTYFLRPEVVNACTRWLALPAPPADPAHVIVADRLLGKGPSMPAPLPGVRSGSSAMPAMVDTDIIVVPASSNTGETLDLISDIAPSYVVVSRPYQGRVLPYAFRTEEIRDLSSWPGSRDLVLMDSLNLHETDSSSVQTAGSIRLSDVPLGAAPPSRRGVVLHEGFPAGVVPEPEALLEDINIVELAHLAAHRPSSHRPRMRRAMPSFAVNIPGSVVLPLATQVPVVDHTPVAARVPKVENIFPFVGSLPVGPEGAGFPDESSTDAPPGGSPGPAAAGDSGDLEGTGDGGGDEEIGGSVEPEAIDPPPPPVTCHFLAEMEGQVQVNYVATVEVNISREEILALADRASAEGKGLVDPTRKIIVQVVPKANFVLAGESGRYESDIPAPGEPLSLYFDVRATNVGDGEVWVLVRQHQTAIARLVLCPVVVERRQKVLTRTQSEAYAAEAPPLQEPLYQLTIIEQTRGNDTYYFYEVDFPAPIDQFRTFESGPLKSERSKYVAALYKEIEDRWTSSQADVEAFTAELQALGAGLFEELLPIELQEILWKHRSSIRSIRVVSTEPFIPWELLHLKEPGKRGIPADGAFLAQMGLVRWLFNVDGLPPKDLAVREGRARYVIPEYPHPDYVLPNAKRERDYLVEKFGATPVDPQPNPVREILSEPGSFDLLHFACHGESQGDDIVNARLLLEGRVEGGSYIPTFLSATTVEGFADLRGAGGTRPIVVLNACQVGRAGYKLTGIGGFSQAFLRSGAGLFVGTLWSVGDSPAASFTEAFYGSLENCQSVAEAAIAAREAARQAKDATWLAYVIYGHPHARLRSHGGTAAVH